MVPDVDDEHSVWGFLVVLVLVLLLAPTLSLAYGNADVQTVVQGERHTIDINNSTSVSAGPGTGYGDDVAVTVTNNSSTTTLTEGTDYSWTASTGEVSFDGSSPDVSDGDTFEVSYQYGELPAATRDVWTLITTVLALQSLYVLIAGLNAIRAYIGQFSKAMGGGI